MYFDGVFSTKSNIIRTEGKAKSVARTGVEPYAMSFRVFLMIPTKIGQSDGSFKVVIENYRIISTIRLVRSFCSIFEDDKL